MKSFYFLFAASLFAVFCLLEWKGVSTDRNRLVASPQYYSYYGGSSSGGVVVVGGSSRSSSYSHK